MPGLGDIGALFDFDWDQYIALKKGDIPLPAPEPWTGAAQVTSGAVPRTEEELADAGLIEDTETALDEEEEPMRRLMKLYRQANPRWSWR